MVDYGRFIGRIRGSHETKRVNGVATIIFSVRLGFGPKKLARLRQDLFPVHAVCCRRRITVSSLVGQKLASNGQPFFPTAGRILPWEEWRRGTRCELRYSGSFCQTRASLRRELVANRDIAATP